PGRRLARPGGAHRRGRGQVRRGASRVGAREDEGDLGPLEVSRGEIGRAAGGLGAMAITTAYKARSDAVPLRSFKTKGRRSAIAGIGVYAPDKIVTNFDLEKVMETSDKWITERTGIRARHFAEPGTTTLELATRAAQSALDNAGLKASDLDMILVGTSSPDGPFPSIACRIQDELDAPGAVAWDLLAACGNVPLGAYAAKEPNPIIDMKGPDVFKFAVDIFIRQAQEVTAAAGISMDAIDLWVPHQANFRIIDAAARRIGLPLDKVAINIDQFGNTSSASIPLALEDAVRNGRVHSGDHVLLAGFGSGLTWGAT